MPKKPNDAFDYAKKISDYFTIVLQIGIGAGAAFALWELAAAHPETAILNEAIAVVVAVCTAYVGAVFLVSIFHDVRSTGFREGRGVLRWLELLLPVVAAGLLISFVYFARTTAQMMM